MLLKNVQTPPAAPAINPGGIFRSLCSHAFTPSMWECLQVDTLDQNYPIFLAGDALSLFDDEVWQCFAECTAVDTPDPVW